MDPVTAEVKVEAAKTTPKVEKPSIVIKDLKVAKDIKVTEHKTCVSFINSHGNKWYLKGKTLEITTLIPALADRTEVLSKEIIEKCHLGYVKGLIKVTDTKDLAAILNRFRSTVSVKPVKAVKKVEEPKAAKTKKASKKTAKVEPTPPVADVPAPVVPDSVDSPVGELALAA